MYRKAITPAFETKKNGKRGKLTGYLSELFDGETLIHDKEYSTYAQAETALDALVFDLLRTSPQAEAEPASTCCFCHAPHHPRDCGEMRALLFAPDAGDPPIDPLPDDGPGDPIPGDPGYEYRIANLIYPPLDVDFAPVAWQV